MPGKVGRQPGAIVAGHVFVSYSRKDSDYVRRLVQHLIAAQIPVWIDDAIDYGQHWEDVICEQVDTCAVIMPVMTPDSASSMWVRNELARARSRDKMILPVLLAGEVFFSLGHVEYEDVTGGRMPTPAFVERIRALVGAAGGPAPAVPTAWAGQALARFERRLAERGARFLRVVTGMIRPAEMLVALHRSADQQKAVQSDGSIVAPNRYTIHVSPFDASRLAPYADELIDELNRAQTEFLDDQGWVIRDELRIRIAEDRDLAMGDIRVAAESESRMNLFRPFATRPAEGSGPQRTTS
jgi:hypothetical protein